MATVAAKGRGAGIVAPALVARARRVGTVAAGVVTLIVALAIGVALLGFDARDPSFDTVTGAAPHNWLGTPGAWVADALLALAGWAAVATLPALVVAGVRLLRGKGVAKWRRYIGATLLGTLALAAAIGLALPDPQAALPAGTGGAVGLAAAASGDALDANASLGAVPLSGLAAGTCLVAALALLAWGSGLDRADAAALAALFRQREDEDEVVVPPRRTAVRDDPPGRAVGREDPATAQAAAAPRATIVVPAPSTAPSARRGRRERQPTLGLGDIYELPGLDLLAPAPRGPVAKIDRAALEQNARLLESVLEDFGVRGRIGDVRPGPVVTMYELEPAPGLKASRVIGLSDDIARSMSAVSARVAVVPGRNVIGIELPNANRQMVTLSELLGSASFDDQSAALPLVLGKNIAGDPVIADLSPMPHLLIAGTTGSGKSVGLNCMILSLLYRLSPQQCRMIMIDPKMLELSPSTTASPTSSAPSSPSRRRRSARSNGRSSRWRTAIG